MSCLERHAWHAKQAIYRGFLVLSVLLAASCSVTHERYREARLMPEPVAKQIVAKHFGAAWVQAPSAQTYAAQSIAGSLFCNDRDFHPLPYADMIVAFVEDPTTWGVSIRGPSFNDNRFCWLMRVVRTANRESQEELVDALVSLGASVRLSADAK